MRSEGQYDVPGFSLSILKKIETSPFLSETSPFLSVHPGRDKLPKGQIFHAAGPSAGGWSIVAIHESKASWEEFRDGILMPRMKQGIKGGFTTPPQETPFEVHNLKP